MWGLRGIEEEVDHADRMEDAAGPRRGLASGHGGGPFSAEGCRHLPAEVRILLVQIGLTEGIGDLADLLETRLQVLGNRLGGRAFGHSTAPSLSLTQRRC